MCVWGEGGRGGAEGGRGKRHTTRSTRRDSRHGAHEKRQPRIPHEVEGRAVAHKLLNEAQQEEGDGHGGGSEGGG